MLSMQRPDAVIRDGQVEGTRSNEIEVTMLGAGKFQFRYMQYSAYLKAAVLGLEVGRSCCVIKYRGATVVCDAGIHPAFAGIPALP